MNKTKVTYNLKYRKWHVGLDICMGVFFWKWNCFQSTRRHPQSSFYDFLARVEQKKGRKYDKINEKT